MVFRLYRCASCGTLTVKEVSEELQPKIGDVVSSCELVRVIRGNSMDLHTLCGGEIIYMAYFYI